MLLLTPSALMADPTAIRLAVIPFSAPQKNAGLQQAASQLPDYLMVGLSRENDFQLVERDKVSAIWSELHLAENGFVSAATAEKLGHILSCDWLVGGSIVQIGTNTQVWIKVIDVRSGVVLDLKTFPYNPTDFSATVSSVPAFLKQVDPLSQPRKFIALGKFADQSLSSTRADWSQRLPALIERHFLDAGYGVVEREAAAPIFSEFQFESAGLTGDYTNRVKLKPAFWIVDGGYKWVYDTQEKLSVALRVQKVGGAVQIFRFTVLPDELEKNVVGSIESMMTNAPLSGFGQTAAEESEARMAEAMKYAGGRDEFANGSVMAMRADVINTLKQVILLNPNNWHAKYMLGRALFETVDPETIREGRDLLNETVTSKDLTYSIMASNLLDDYDKGRLTVKALPFGGFQITPHGQPLSWPNFTSTSLPPLNAQAQAPAINQITNVMPRANPVLQVSPPLSSAYFEKITAVKYYHGKVFVACRTQLYEYDPVTASTVEIKLPVNFLHNIVALEADDHDLWLGSDGDGLVQISRSGELIHHYGENDGFPSASVNSLEMQNGRLLVGFGNHDSGYIDLGPGKFIGHMSDIIMFKPGNDMLPPPSFPPAPGTNTDFMVSRAQISDEFLLNGCVALCKPHGTNWFMISLSTNDNDNVSYCAVVDQTLPGLLWIGLENGTIAFLDMNKLEVVGECHFTHGDSGVEWMFNDGGKMIVITMGYYSATYNLYCFEKPSFTGPRQLVTSTGQAATAPYIPPPPGIPSPANPSDADWPFDYMQQNFSKFVLVQFQKDGNGQAVLQQFHVHDNMFMSQDEIFFGFKFTTPPWLDGDVQWMSSVIKTGQNKLWASREWDQDGVITADDSMDDDYSFNGTTEYSLVDYPRLHELLPYTHNFSVQTIRCARLKPGKTYAIWFDVEEKDYPDLLFAITINSRHGADEYGTLPMVAGPPQPGPMTTDNPPRTPEELRSRFETALKSKDEAAALSLVYWQGSGSPGLDDRCLQADEYSKDGIGGEIDRMMARHIGPVRLRPWSYPFGMTNIVEGVPYGPNIPGVGEIEVESTDLRWDDSILYGRQGNGYYLPVGIKEPVSTAK